jgi:hypothetical protein
MADVLVCKDNWNGVKDESFNWHNNTGTAVSITQNGNATWPFTSASPINVPANSRVACGLIGTSGTYTYDSGPCTTLGNPKTIIIS